MKWSLTYKTNENVAVLNHFGRSACSANTLKLNQSYALHDYKSFNVSCNYNFYLVILSVIPTFRCGNGSTIFLLL